MSDEVKQFVTLEGLERFLENFKYCMAHNDIENSNEDSKNTTPEN